MTQPDTRPELAPGDVLSASRILRRAGYVIVDQEAYSQRREAQRVEVERLTRERDELHAALDAALRTFHESVNAPSARTRTGWVDIDRVTKWRALVERTLP